MSWSRPSTCFCAYAVELALPVAMWALRWSSSLVKCFLPGLSCQVPSQGGTQVTRVGRQKRVLLLQHFHSGNRVDLLIILLSVDFFVFLSGGIAVFLKCSLVLGGGRESKV